MHRMDKYRDDETGDITVKSVSTAVFDAYLDALLGTAIFGTELYAIIKGATGASKWYGLSVNGVDSVNDMVESVVNLAQNDWSTDKGKEKGRQKLLKAGQNLAQLLGIPLSNGIKIGEAVYNWILDAKNGQLGSFEAGFERTKAQKSENLIRAYEAGNEEAVQAWTESFDSEKNALAAVKSGLKNKVADGEMAEDDAIRILERTGMNTDDAYWTARGWDDEDKYTELKAAAIAGDKTTFQAEIKQLKEHGVDEKDAVSSFKTFLKKAMTGKELTEKEAELLNGQTITDQQAVKMLQEYAGMDSNKAYLAVRNWRTGYESDFSAIKKAALSGDKAAFQKEMQELTGHGYKEKDVQEKVTEFVKKLYFGKELGEEEAEIAGGQTLTDEQARRLLNSYGGLSVNKAVETVSGWMKDKAFMSKNGWAYSDRKSLYINGEISKQTLRKALMDYGKLTSDDADAKIREFDYEKDTGYSWSERKADFQRGDISKANMQQYLQKYGGMTREKAAETVEVWTWQNGVNGAENITASAVKNYNTYCAGAGVQKETFVKAWNMYNDTKADYYANGKIVTDSKLRKVIAQINALPVSSAQKNAIARCFYEQKSIDKYRPW